MADFALPHDHGRHKHDEALHRELMNTERFSAVADVFKQLSDPVRVRIFWLLSHREECVINIAAMMDMSSPAVSHHLKSLLDSGLIMSRRDGKEVYYKASDTEQIGLLHEIVEQVMEITCPEKEVDFQASQEEIIRNVHNYLIEHISERITIETLSREFLMNTTTLKTVFKKVYGTTIAAHMKQHRMELAAGLLLSANSLIRLGSQTVTEISEYGKLLLPVMTAAMAAQGGAASSTALYAGTAMFDSVLSSLISRLLGPMVYLFLALSAANGAIGENILGKLRDLVKNIVSWSLKAILTVFTTYMTVTGVVSGTTDAAALKATKVTISSVVPVVGGILSDASEAVLVSAGLMKNAAGIYGILAVFLSPFLKIGVHYLILKLTAAVCGIFGEKGLTELIGDFSTAMGLLLAMTGSECLLLLISTVCFLKGVG